MKTVTRDEFARMMMEETAKFPAGEGDEKFNKWLGASETLASVGQPFAGHWEDTEDGRVFHHYKRLKHLPLDVRQIVVEAMRELEVEKIT